MSADMASWVGSAAGTMARVLAMTMFLITLNRSVTAIRVSIAATHTSPSP